MTFVRVTPAHDALDTEPKRVLAPFHDADARAAGRIGAAVGTLLSEAGHDVLFGGREPSKLTHLDKRHGGPGRTGDLADAVRHGEAVLISVPFREVDGLLDSALFGDKIVIDATNPYSAQGKPLHPSGAPSGAEHIAALLPNAQVVKAFNTLFAGILERMAAADPDVDGLVVWYAGDHDRTRHRLESHPRHGVHSAPKRGASRCRASRTARDALQPANAAPRGTGGARRSFALTPRMRATEVGSIGARMPNPTANT